jgi:hypothetical protein
LIGKQDPITRDAVLAKAEAWARQAWRRPTLIQFVRYFRDGDRDEQQNAYSAVRERLGHTTLAAAYTGQDRWLDEAADAVAVLCEMLTWCWSAHDEFIAESGDVVPDPDRPFLDLGAAETVSELAWVDHLLGERFDDRVPGLRRLIRREANRRVIDPFLEHGWWWVREPETVNNWNPWICSQVLTAALLLEDDPDKRARIVGLVASRVDVYLASLPEDGGIDEGFAYWWQGMGRLMELLDLLDRASAGAVRIDGFGPLRQAGLYPARMRWSRDWHINSGDGPARAQDDLPWSIVHRFARRCGDDWLAGVAASYREPSRPAFTILDSMGLGRAVMCLADSQWLGLRTNRSEGQPQLRTDVWMPTSQVALIHGDGGLSFSIKGAHNEQSHNHNDAGNLTVALDGAPYVVDAGAPTYTSQTFSDRRYELWPMQSAWHNVPAPFGADQGFGRRFHAGDMSVDRDESGCHVEMELSEAYKLSRLTSWRRRVCLNQAGTRLTVTERAEAGRDATGLDEGTEPMMMVRYLLAGQVTLGVGYADCAGPEAVAPPVLDGPWIPVPTRPADAPPPRVLRLSWPPEILVEVEEQPLSDPRLMRVWGDKLTRLTLRGAVTANTMTVTMEVQP